MKMYLLSLLTFMVVIAIVVFSGDLPVNSLIYNPIIQRAGGVILLIGLIVRLLAWIPSGKFDIRDKIEGDLPTTGIYKFMRHPKLWASFVMYIGASIGVASLIGLILSIAIVLPVTFYRIKFFEENLKKTNHIAHA